MVRVSRLACEWAALLSCVGEPLKRNVRRYLILSIRLKLMGTEFTAVVNHNLNERDIYTLPDLLNAMWYAVEDSLPIIDGYPVAGSSPPKWQWSRNEGGFSLERLHRHGTVMIEGSEFHGIVSERVFRVCHGVSWWSFLTEQTVRDRLRCVCQHTAAVLGSKQIIYLPDGFLKPEGAIGLMYEGKAIEEMIDWLIKNCGTPTQDVESIYCGVLESWNANSYYIELV